MELKFIACVFWDLASYFIDAVYTTTIRYICIAFYKRSLGHEVTLRFLSLFIRPESVWAYLFIVHKERNSNLLKEDDYKYSMIRLQPNQIMS